MLKVTDRGGSYKEAMKALQTAPDAASEDEESE